MRVIGLAGWSGAGKTTLLVRLIPELNRRGLAVSTLKHAHHAFDIDRPGKDSFEHRAAGSREVLIASARRWAWESLPGRSMSKAWWACLRVETRSPQFRRRGMSLTSRVVFPAPLHPASPITRMGGV